MKSKYVRLSCQTSILHYLQSCSALSFRGEHDTLYFGRLVSPKYCDSQLFAFFMTTNELKTESVNEAERFTELTQAFLQLLHGYIEETR